MRENPLIRKLLTVGSLSADAQAALEALCADVRGFPANRDIIREGDQSNAVHLLLEGWAARYKALPQGQRQITAFLLPGDFCDLHVTVLKQMDHSVLSLSETRIACIPVSEMEALPRRLPEVARVMWWSTLVDEAILREWLVSTGRRNAYQALAHLLCELHARLRRVGLAEHAHFELPVTQEQLADALGLTTVHVNRTLKRLRNEGLVSLAQKMVTIRDSASLCEAAGFDLSYLHPEPLRFASD